MYCVKTVAYIRAERKKCLLLNSGSAFFINAYVIQ